MKKLQTAKSQSSLKSVGIAGRVPAMPTPQPGKEGKQERQASAVRDCCPL